MSQSCHITGPWTQPVSLPIKKTGAAIKNKLSSYLYTTVGVVATALLFLLQPFLNHLKPSVDGAAGLKINASAIDWDNYTVQLLCLCCVHSRAALLRDVIYYQVEMLKPELTSSQAQGNWPCLLEHLCNCVMAKVARRRKKKKKEIDV